MQIVASVAHPHAHEVTTGSWNGHDCTRPHLGMQKPALPNPYQETASIGS